MKTLLVAGWVMLIPITWGILTSEVMTSGSKLLQGFAFGAIGFCVAVMVTGTVAVYFLSKREKVQDD